MPAGNGNWVTAEEYIRRTIATLIENQDGQKDELEKLREKQTEQCLKLGLMEGRGYFWPSVIASIVGSIIIIIIEFVIRK